MRSALLLLLWLLLAPGFAYSEGRGDELVNKYLNDSVRRNAIVSMAVDYREGDRQPVHLEFTWMRRIKEGLVSHLLRVEAPPSEKGKLLLVQEKPGGQTEYIAYRPNSALKKKVRVSGARNYKYKALSISVQELVGGELQKYSHTYKGSERIEGVECQVVENVLQTRFKSDSNYPRSVIYLREDNGMPQKWDLFDGAGKVQKTIRADEINKIEDVWTVTHVTVQDFKRKGELKLVLKQARYHPTLEDQWFTEEYLKQSSK